MRIADVLSVSRIVLAAPIVGFAVWALANLIGNHWLSL